MITIWRAAGSVPKRPRKPEATGHFWLRWSERAEGTRADFWQQWATAEFLGETYEHRGRRRSARIQYWRVGGLVILVTHPNSGARRLLSCWTEDWWRRQWDAASYHSDNLEARRPSGS